MTMVSLPNILFEVGADVGDLEYIEGKVIAGDYFQVSGDIDNLNDTIEFIVPNGRTAFLIEAKIAITAHPLPATRTSSGSGSNSTLNIVEAIIKIDTVKKDTTNLGFVSHAASGAVSPTSLSQNSYGNIGDGRFNVLGLSLVGDAAKKIEIENTLDNGTAFATMSGYLV